VATSVQITFRASKADQNREGHTITRVRSPDGPGDGGAPVGAFEAIMMLLNVSPQLPGKTPLMARRTGEGWKVITRIHSGRIGGATQLAAQGMSELQIQRAGRWKSRAFMVYVREAGEGAKAVSAALARNEQSES